MQAELATCSRWDRPGLKVDDLDYLKVHVSPHKDTYLNKD